VYSSLSFGEDWGSFSDLRAIAAASFILLLADLTPLPRLRAPEPPRDESLPLLEEIDRSDVDLLDAVPFDTPGCNPPFELFEDCGFAEDLLV